MLLLRLAIERRAIVFPDLYLIVGLNAITGNDIQVTVGVQIGHSQPIDGSSPVAMVVTLKRGCLGIAPHVDLSPPAVEGGAVVAEGLKLKEVDPL